MILIISDRVDLNAFFVTFVKISIMNCTNCQTEFDSKFCPDCGSPVQHRINAHFVMHEIQHGIFHFEQGFLYTLKELALRPGHSVRSYIDGNRAKFYKPVGFVVLTSLLYLFVKHLLHFEELYAGKLPGVYTNKMMQWVGEHYNYSNLIEILFIALLLRGFFSIGYNYFEYLVLLCYLTGFGMLLGTVAMVVSDLTNLDSVFTSVFFNLVLAYSVWGIGQFNGGGRADYLKAALAYVLGMFFFSAVILMIGFTLDFLL